MENSNLEDVSAAVGYTATRKLVAWFSGRMLYVPEICHPDHPLERLIGNSAFRALVSNFGRKKLWIPSSAEDKRYAVERVMAEQIGEGMSNDELAERHGLTLRRVAQLRQELNESGWVDFARGIGPAPKLAGRRNAGLDDRHARNF